MATAASTTPAPRLPLAVVRLRTFWHTDLLSLGHEYERAPSFEHARARRDRA